MGGGKTVVCPTKQRCRVMRGWGLCLPCMDAGGPLPVCGHAVPLPVVLANTYVFAGHMDVHISAAALEGLPATQQLHVSGSRENDGEEKYNSQTNPITKSVK